MVFTGTQDDDGTAVTFVFHLVHGGIVREIQVIGILGRCGRKGLDALHGREDAQGETLGADSILFRLRSRFLI